MIFLKPIIESDINLSNLQVLIGFTLIFFLGNLLCQYISVRKSIVKIDYFQSLIAALTGIMLGFGYHLTREIELISEFTLYTCIFLTGITFLSMISGLINLLISKDSTKIKNCFFILSGLFRTNKNESSFSNISHLMSRFTWELPQTLIGYLFSQTMNGMNRVGEVLFVEGATFSFHYLKTNRRQGVSIGNFIYAGLIERAIRFENDPLLLHEYGHYLQSRRWGLLYLFVIGIPSLISAIRAKPLPGGITTHDLRWYEMQANSYAALYLKSNFDIDWVKFEPPYGSFPRTKGGNLT